jgi:hypothetical protein
MNFDGLYASLILIAALIVVAGLGVAGVRFLVNVMYKRGHYGQGHWSTRGSLVNTGVTGKHAGH